MPDRRMPRRGTIAAAAVGISMLAAAAGCSSSSSPSSTPTPTGPPPPTSLHGHKAGGPNGIITAPVSNPPSSGVPGGSETFPHISAKSEKKLANRLSSMAGVRTVTYYPQFHQLQVYYASDATGAQRTAVYDVVTAH